MKSIKTIRRLGFAWAILGISILLVLAMVRISPHAAELIEYELSAFHVVLLVLTVLAMAYLEGYRGFHNKFSPRYAARSAHVLDSAKGIDLVLAPLFCMSYYKAAKARIISAWSITLAIVLLVFLMRHISQPWRGIVSAGVLVGLLYGLISVLYFSFRSKTRDSSTTTGD